MALLSALTLTYQPGERLVEASIKLGLNMPKGFVSEGQGLPIGHDSEILLTSTFVLAVPGDSGRSDCWVDGLIYASSMAMPNPARRDPDLDRVTGGN
jgi:hypothetical protein